MALTHQEMQGLIDAHRSKNSDETDKWDRWRKWHVSEFWSGGTDGPQGSGQDMADSDLSMETNYSFAFTDTMIANVTPTNPQITITPRRDALEEAGKFREALVNDTLVRVNAHERLWQVAAHASVYGRAFLKTVWNTRRHTPDFLVLDPRSVWFDLSAARWEDIRYLIEVTVLTKSDFESRIRKKGAKDRFYDPKVADRAQFAAYPEWLKDSAGGGSHMTDASEEVFEWVVIYEVFDFTSGDGKCYHFLDGIPQPLFEGDLPYRFVRNPYRMLTFNDNLTDIGGLSDVKLIAPMLERLNELDTLAVWFAQTSIPFMVMNSGLVDNPEHAKRLFREGSSPGTVIDIAGKANARIDDIIKTVGSPSLVPEFKGQRDRLAQTIEFVLGIPQYSRGVVGVTDVATEVALADSATRTRNGRRQKSMLDTVVWMSRSIIGLYMEYLGDETVLPLRLTDNPKAQQIGRLDLGFQLIKAEMGEGPLDYDYEAVAYSPTENNRLVQLKNLTQYMELLLNSPAVNKVKLVKKVLELLQMDSLLEDPKTLLALQQQGRPAAGPPGPGGQPPPPPGGDTLAGGALPPGTEPVLPPNGQGGAGAISGGFGGSGLPVPPPPGVS